MNSTNEAVKKGRKELPSYLIVDSQSVKTLFAGEERSFHGGKKVKGRSRQVAVDTQGLIWGVHAHAANKSDTKEGCVLAQSVLLKLPDVEGFSVDAGYRGTFVDYVEKNLGKAVHVSQRIKDEFAILPKRWVVERTFGWFKGSRRLSKDYEKTTSSAEAFLHLFNLKNILNFGLF